MNISKHITLHEATTSPTALRLGIKNEPDKEMIEHMVLVAEKCFEPLREWYGKPLKVNSFYRCYELNKAVGGSATSQHVKGQAIDISAGSKEENKKLFEWCKANLTYDQLINEYNFSWVHISFALNMNRNQVLTIL